MCLRGRSEPCLGCDCNHGIFEGNSERLDYKEIQRAGVRRVDVDEA